MYGVGVFAIANAEFYSRVHFTMDVLVLSMKYNKKSFLISLHPSFKSQILPLEELHFFQKPKLKDFDKKNPRIGKHVTEYCSISKIGRYITVNSQIISALK